MPLKLSRSAVYADMFHHLPQPASQTLLLSSSLNDRRGLFLHTIDINGVSIPRYTVRTSSSKPQLQIFSATPNRQGTLIGTASSSSLSSSIVVLLHGYDVRLKYDMLSAYTFVHPTIGKLKWKSGWTGQGLKLVDNNGITLAKTNGKSIEILVPGDELLVDMVVVTGLAVKKHQDKENKEGEEIADAADVISAVLGT